MSVKVRDESDWPRVFKRLSQVPIPKSGLEVVLRRPKRTNAQNDLLWAVYQEFAKGLTEQTGQRVTSKQIHEVCKDHFLPKQHVPGFEKPISGSTTALAKSGDGGFQDYLEQIRALAAEMGVYIHAG